jgi:hypothetical protein
MSYRSVDFVGEAFDKIQSLQNAKDEHSKKLIIKILKTTNFIEESSRVSSEIFQKIQGTKKSWEIRVDYNKLFHRFYGTYEKGELIIMRYYLSKKSNSTPKKIILKLKRDEKA